MSEYIYESKSMIALLLNINEANTWQEGGIARGVMKSAGILKYYEPLRKWLHMQSRGSIGALAGEMLSLGAQCQ